MSAHLSQFWQAFHARNFNKAQQEFSSLKTNEKQLVLEQLFQESSFHRKPFMISVLRGTLHDDKVFDDFYKSWLPDDLCTTKVEVGGQIFQQGFPTPVRVINAVNINNSKEIISVGMSWAANKEEEQEFWDYLQKLERGEDKINEIRHARITKVVDRELLGLFRVETDDNLGSSF